MAGCVLCSAAEDDDPMAECLVRLFWRWKCRAGRPRIPVELRALIRRMAGENPAWGEERIANELLVKLGIQVSPRTVRKYMPKRPHGQPRGDQR